MVCGRSWPYIKTTPVSNASAVSNFIYLYLFNLSTYLKRTMTIYCWLKGA